MHKHKQLTAHRRQALRHAFTLTAVALALICLLYTSPSPRD